MSKKVEYYWKFDEHFHQLKIEMTNETRHPSHPENRTFYLTIEDALDDQPTVALIENV